MHAPVLSILLRSPFVLAYSQSATVEALIKCGIVDCNLHSMNCLYICMFCSIQFAVVVFFFSVHLRRMPCWQRNWEQMNIFYARVRPHSGTVYFIDTLHLTIYLYDHFCGNTEAEQLHRWKRKRHRGYRE